MKYKGQMDIAALKRQVNKVQNVVANRFRRRRFATLRRLLDSVPRPLRILDVGGSQDYWATVGMTDARDVSIVLLNLRMEGGLPLLPNFSFREGDATDLRGIPDRSFDVCFSNSVIEHVGGWEGAQAMAREVRRVGARYIVQTPNYYFPIEPHFQFPGFQFLPLDVRADLAYRLRLGWEEQGSQNRDEALERVRGIELVTPTQLRTLFPDGVMEHERVLGLTKSMTVHAGF